MQKILQKAPWCWRSPIGGCVAIRLKSPAWPGVRITTLGSSLSHMMAQRRSVDGCKPVNDGGRCTRISASTRWLSVGRRVFMLLSACRHIFGFYCWIFLFFRCGMFWRKQLSLTTEDTLVICCVWTGPLWIQMWSGLEGRTSPCRSGASPNKSSQSRLKVTPEP